MALSDLRNMAREANKFKAGMADPNSPTSSPPSNPIYSKVGFMGEDLSNNVNNSAGQNQAPSGEGGGVVGGFKKAGEFAMGASGKVYNFAANITHDLLKLSKWINPVELAAKLTGQASPFADPTANAIKKAGEQIQAGIYKAGKDVHGLDSNSSFTKGGEMFTNILGTVMAATQAPTQAISKIGALGRVKAVASANQTQGLTLNGLSGFMLNSALRMPQTIVESAYSSQVFSRGATGQGPTMGEIRKAAGIDLSVQLALGTVGFLLKPATKIVMGLVGGVGGEAVETILDVNARNKVMGAVEGKWDINDVRKAAKPAFDEIQQKANAVWKESMEKFIPNKDNIFFSFDHKTFNLKLASDIQEEIAPRMATLTTSEKKQVQGLMDVIMSNGDLSFDGMKNLSIRMGNEINLAKLENKVSGNFESINYTVDKSIDKLLNQATNGGWSQVNDAYRPYKELQKNLKPLMSPNQKTVESFLRGAEVSTIDRNVTVQYLEQLDELTGSTMAADLKAINAAKQFNQGEGVYGGFISKIGIGKLLGGLLSKVPSWIIDPKVTFPHYMAVPMGVSKAFAIPFERKDPLNNPQRLPIPSVDGQGGLDFGIEF